MDETTLQQMLTTYSCIDNPSAQDYPFDKYLAMIEGQVWVWTLTKRPYSQWIAFNQWQVWACTFYGPTLANNWQQINAFNSQSLTYTQIDPMTLWVKQQIHTYAIYQMIWNYLNKWQ